MNPYLEKVAKLIEREEGIYQEGSSRRFHVSDEVLQRVMEKKYAEHLSQGRKTFGTVGGALGLTMGASKGGLKGLLLGTAAGTAVGVLAGHALASAGNKQTFANSSIPEQEAGKYIVRKRYFPYNDYIEPKVIRKDGK